MCHFLKLSAFKNIIWVDTTSAGVKRENKIANGMYDLYVLLYSITRVGPATSSSKWLFNELNGLLYSIVSIYNDNAPREIHSPP